MDDPPNALTEARQSGLLERAQATGAALLRGPLGLVLVEPGENIPRSLLQADQPPEVVAWPRVLDLRKRIAHDLLQHASRGTHTTGRHRWRDDLPGLYVAGSLRTGTLAPNLRRRGLPVVGAWMDDGPHVVHTYWARAAWEVQNSSGVLLHGQPASPSPEEVVREVCALRDAIAAAAVALSAHLPVVYVAPDMVDPDLGSWTAHPLASRADTLEDAAARLGFHLGPA